MDQDTYLLMLVNRWEGTRFPNWWSIEGEYAVTRKTKTAEKSAMIDELKRLTTKYGTRAERDAKLAAEAAEAPAVPVVPQSEGGPSPAEILAMLGRKVRVSFTSKSGEMVTYAGSCQRVEASDVDGTPALFVMEHSGRTREIRCHRLTAWAVTG